MTDPGSSAEFPAGAELTHLLVIADLSRAVAFYRDVVGAELVREYGGTSAVFRLAGTWLLLVTPGGPTSDKPTVVFAPPDDPDRVSAEMTFRVSDCRAAWRTLEARGRASSPRRSITDTRSGASSATLMATCWS